MTHWTVDAPTVLEFDDVTEVNVRLIGGTVAVLASDDRQLSPGGTTPRAPRATLAVSELTGRPLQVSHSAGVLTVSYESLTWDGLLGFLKPRKDSVAVTITVPASHTVSGNVGAGTGGVSVSTMSGAVTLLRRAAVNTRGFEPPSPPVAGMESKTQ